MNQGLGISRAAKAAIDTKKANLYKRREPSVPLEEQIEDDLDIELDPSRRLFYDSEIKFIKQSFRAKDVPHEKGWVAVCRTYLEQSLQRDEELLDEFSVYLSTRNDRQRLEIFKGKEIDWKDATKLCSISGMGYSDAMILNVLNSCEVPYLATLDYDIVYGATVSIPNKTVLIPDERRSSFKRPLKDAPQIVILPRSGRDDS